MNFQEKYKAGAIQFLEKIGLNQAFLSENDASHLPVLVRKYLEFTGSFEKARTANLRAVFEGGMRTSVSGRWRKVKARQHSFFNESVRLFYIRSSILGIPFEGLHIYSAAIATMQIRLASLFTVVDAKGEKMNQSETVTFFNDMCLIAPATLADRRITWEETDTKTVSATFKMGDVSISARLIFNADGSLADFISKDRFLSEDGKTYVSYPWSTPVHEYKTFEGRKIPSIMSAVWHMPDKQFTYAKFELKEIEYNCREFR